MAADMRKQLGRYKANWANRIVSAAPGAIAASILGSADILGATMPMGEAPPLPPGQGNQLVQADPSQDRLPETPDLAPLPDVQPELTPTPPAEQTPSGPDTPFQVTDIQVVGSTVFDDATLDAIVSPFEGLEATLSDLEQAANGITQLYLESDYITSRAIIEPQTVIDGVVQIQVIEGELEEIQVEGTNRLQDYVRARVALGAARPLNKARLEDQLRLLRSDPLFETVEASLQAGSGSGKSRLVVRISEAPPFSGSIFSDNYSPPAVGDVRFGTRLQLRNLAGVGDTVFGSASITDTVGSRVYELGYEVPINPMDGTVLIRYAPNDFRITDRDQPTFELETEGSTDIYEIRVRQPLIRTPRQEFALSLGYRHRRGSTLIADVITDETQTNVISFGQDYLRRDLQGAWAAQSQFRLGWEQSDETVFTAEDSRSFFSWNGQVQRVQQLGTNHLLILQGSAQFSPDTLPGSEQFFIGGGISIRGYEQNQRFGDNGVRFSIEDRITITRNETGLPFFQVAPFLDGGYVANDGESPLLTDNNVLLGAGVGMLLNLGGQFGARADLAYPIIDIEELATDEPSGVQLYFSLNYRF